MWHILVRLVDGCREIWGSCAIYVGIPNLILANELELRHLCPKRQLDVEKKMGGNQRSANFPLGFAPENGPHQVSSFLWQTQEKATFRRTWWGPFSRAKQSGKLPERRRLQKIGHFQGHRWRNSHSFAKIRLGMSHRWRNSLISPDIHQPT